MCVSVLVCICLFLCPRVFHLTLSVSAWARKESVLSLSTYFCVCVCLPALTISFPVRLSVFTCLHLFTACVYLCLRVPSAHRKAEKHETRCRGAAAYHFAICAL